MAKKIVLLDIDYTLFNTDAFRDATYPRLMDILQNPDLSFYTTQVQEIEHELIRAGGYEPVAFARMLAQLLDLKPEQEHFEQLFYSPSLYEQSLYPEVKEVVRSLSQRSDITLGIVSQGEVSFQKRKIAPLQEYFDEKNIFISPKKTEMLERILKQYEGDSIFVVDDSVQFLDAIKKTNHHVTTILVEKENRYEKRKVPEGFQPDARITLLSEVERYIT